MNPLEAVALVALIFLPFHCLVQWQVGRMSDPAHLREEGIVILREEILDARSEPIGDYMGRRIPGSVIFLGMLYAPAHIA